MTGLATLAKSYYSEYSVFNKKAGDISKKQENGFLSQHLLKRKKQKRYQQVARE